MKPSKTDLLEWIAIRNRAHCFTLFKALDTIFLTAIDLSSSLREHFNPSPLLCFFSIKGEPGRNGNPGEVGFSGSPVSLYLPIRHKKKNFKKIN